mgnify:CR=1 FL=1
MRKKLFSIFMIAALIAVSGPLDIFAGTEVENVDPSNSVETVVVDDQNGTPENGTDQINNEEPTEGTETPVVEPAPAETTEEVEPAREVASEITVGVVEATPSTVKLAWTVSEDLEGQAATVLNGEETVASDLTEPMYTVTGLVPNTSYTFTVKIGDTTGTTEAMTAPVGAVSGLRALSSYNAVKLVWSPVTGASSYEVSYSGTWGSGAASVGGATEFWHYGFPTYDVTNTASGPIVPTDYTYKVTAKDSAGNVLAESTTTGYPVRTMYYKLTFKKKVKLTSHSGGKYKTTFYKGQVVYARGFDGGKYHFDYLCADGTVRTYYAMKIRAKAAIWTDHINPGKEYTAEEATMYVNARGITASKKKKYMVWVNTYTQREYVFYGSTGNWTCGQGPWLVSTGKASKPTATGSTNISSRKKKKHGIPTWSMCRYFSLHGKQKSWVLGWPRSGACVRNYNENASWIYYTVPMKSRVFVF